MSRFKRSMVVLFALCATLAVNAQQSEAIARFLRNNPDIRELYIYQSAMRILNTEGNEDFNMFIRDLRKAVVYLSDEKGSVSAETVDLLRDRLEEEGFEFLVATRNKNTMIHFMSKETGGTTQYILVMREPESFALVELDGEVDLGYLHVIQGLDPGRLTSMITGEEGDQAVEKN